MDETSGLVTAAVKIWQKYLAIRWRVTRGLQFKEHMKGNQSQYLIYLNDNCSQQHRCFQLEKHHSSFPHVTTTPHIYQSLPRGMVVVSTLFICYFHYL